LKLLQKLLHKLNAPDFIDLVKFWIVYGFVRIVYQGQAYDITIATNRQGGGQPPC